MTDTTTQTPAPVQEKHWAEERVAALTAQKKALEAENDTLRRAIPVEQKIELTPAQLEYVSLQKAEILDFNKECNKIHDAGEAKYGDFKATLANLNPFGGLNRPIAEAVMVLDNPHEVLYQLGKNTEEAGKILALPLTKQGAALAKFALGLEAKAPKVSKAPEPISPVVGNANTENSDDPEQMSMAKWIEHREKTRKTRR